VYCRCLFDGDTLTTDRGVYLLDAGEWLHIDGPDNVSSAQLGAIRAHIEAIIAAQP
jgi:hypothetical protein